MQVNKFIRCVLVLGLLVSLPAGVYAWWGRKPASHEGVLITHITMEGFVLGDKEKFTKLFRPYLDKYMTTEDMDNILHEIKLIYEREGYQQLVSITYQVKKHHLIYTALMTS